MVHTLYIATAGTVSLDFRDPGRITCVVISSADAAAGGAELSFNSSAQLTTNDTTGTIAGLVLQGNANGPPVAVFHLDESVDAGERIYLHVTGAANATRAFICVSGAGTRASSRRR